MNKFEINESVGINCLVHQLEGVIMYHLALAHKQVSDRDGFALYYEARTPMRQPHHANAIRVALSEDQIRNNIALYLKKKQ